MGQVVLYPVSITQAFELNTVPFYVILGILTGLFSVYFAKMYMFVGNFFNRWKSWVVRLIVGGLVLGGLIFLMPSLFGEGFEVINAALSGNTDHLFDNTIYEEHRNEFWVMIAVFLMILFFKVIATSVTFKAGGIGGIFAPSLFLGSNLGLMYGLIVEKLGWSISLSNLSLVGMAGAIAGVIHAPLTAVFLIAEITGGYALFMPLMIVSALSYVTVRIFTKNSVYTKQLADRGELLTHNADKNMLSLLRTESLIEKNFLTVSKNNTLRELTNVISNSSRAVYVVLDDEQKLEGIIWLDNVRHIMFQQELYDTIYVKDIMTEPSDVISTNMSVSEIVSLFENSDKYNLPVVDEGKYIGFISRAKMFSKYRQLLKHYSND